MHPGMQALGATAVLLGPLTAGTSSAEHREARPISFFSAEPSLATAPDPNAPMREIKQVVQALHDAGIEAILQVITAGCCLWKEGTLCMVPAVSVRLLLHRTAELDVTKLQEHNRQAV